MPQPREYDVAPRYYDPDKERIEARYQEIRQEMGATAEVNEDVIRKRIAFRQDVESKWSTSSFNRQYIFSNLRLVLILLVLLGAFYYTYQYLELL